MAQEPETGTAEPSSGTETGTGTAPFLENSAEVPRDSFLMAGTENRNRSNRSMHEP